MSVATARFELKMNAAEKHAVTRAAAIMGTSMAGFVRAAVKEKAQDLLDQQSRLTLSAADFKKFSKALDHAFTPNRALRSALTDARKKVRRA